MNKFLSLIVALLFARVTQAAPLESALKMSYDPGYASVIFSLIVVICLIYATGIIYNKLNNLGIKTLKAQKKDINDDRITILSTTPLGANRTLHVVELNGKKMLIGASTNSIHLIKDLSEENITTAELQNVENIEISEDKSDNDTIKNNNSDDEEFGLYKKYLR